MRGVGEKIGMVLCFRDSARNGRKLGWFYASEIVRGMGENWDGSMLQR